MPRFSRKTSSRRSSIAPQPNGNYSHAIREGKNVHICGWMGVDPQTTQIVPGGIQAQTEQAIQNIASCLIAAGSSMEKITRRRIYMIDIRQVQEVDKIWAQWVSEPWPVSTCIGVTALAKEDALVELEVDAVVDDEAPKPLRLGDGFLG